MRTTRYDTARHATARNRTEQNGTAWHTFANPGARRLRARWMDHPRSGRDSATHPSSLAHPVRRLYAADDDDEPPCRAFPLSSLSLQPQARHLPLERGSSLGWDQYERANAGNSRAGPSPPSTMDTHRCILLARALAFGLSFPSLPFFSHALSLSYGSTYCSMCLLPAPSPLRLPIQPRRSRFLLPPLCFP